MRNRILRTFAMFAVAGAVVGGGAAYAAGIHHHHAGRLGSRTGERHDRHVRHDRRFRFNRASLPRNVRAFPSR